MSSAKSCGSSAFPKWSLTDSFDRFGNRWSQAVTAGSGPSSSLNFGTNGINGSTNNQPNGYTFDPSGNMTVEPLTPQQNYMTYDGENRMTAVSGGGAGSYSYDGNGLRVVKSSGGTTTVSIFSGSSVIAEYDNGAAPDSPSREYVYGGSGLLAMFSGGATTYYHQDHLSVRLTTDANGNVLSQEGHFPYGEQWYQSGSGNKWFFTSYDRDSESGLDYAMARYYDSRTGTFCSADPLAGSPDDPQSWNRYPYGRNDPIDITDPSGKNWLFSLLQDISFAAIPFTGGASIPFAVGFGDLNAFSNLVNGQPPWAFGSFDGGVSLGSSWNGTPIMPYGGLTKGVQNALGLPTMADVPGPVFDSTRGGTNSAMVDCSNVQFLVNRGNRSHIGKQGATRYEINSGSAVIAPEQFGDYSSGAKLAQDLPQYQFSGSVTIPHLVQKGKRKVWKNYTFSFNNWADVIGNQAGVEGQLPNETARQALLRQNPGRILLELPGLPFDYSGPGTGRLRIASSVGCP